MNSVYGLIKEVQILDEPSDSIRLVKHRFRSGEIGKSERVYKVKYPIRWDFVNNKRRNRRVPGKCTGYPAHSPQTRTSGTTASGSSVLILLTESENNQAVPSWRTTVLPSSP